MNNKKKKKKREIAIENCRVKLAIGRAIFLSLIEMTRSNGGHDISEIKNENI